MKLEGNSDWQDYQTSHYNLCKYNGVVRLGSLQSGFKHVDCKEVQTISIQYHAKQMCGRNAAMA